MTPPSYVAGGMTCSFQIMALQDPVTFDYTYWDVDLYSANYGGAGIVNYVSGSRLVGRVGPIQHQMGLQGGEKRYDMNGTIVANITDPSGSIPGSILTLNITRRVDGGAQNEYSHSAGLLAAQLSWTTS